MGLPRWCASVAALALATAGCGASTPAGDRPSAAPVAAAQGFDLPEPVGLATGAGKVWAVSVHDGSVIARTTVDGPAELRVHVGTTPLRAVYDGHLLWVSVFGDNRVVAVDPVTGHVVRRVRVAGQPEGLVAAFGGVWVVRQQARALTRIAADGALGPTYHLGDEPRLVTANPQYLFASNFTSGTVTRIDPLRAAVRTSPYLCSGAQDLAVLGQTLWVSCTPGNTVAAVDIDTMRETGHVEVSGEPDALRVVGSKLYVVTTSGPTLIELNPDPQHPSTSGVTKLGTAPALADIANVDAVNFRGQWWVSSPVLDRVIVYTP